MDSQDGLPNSTALPNPPKPPPIDQTVGNHVTVQIGPGLYVLYAHLDPGSVKVHIGQRVHTGQLLGLIGTSGNSTTPHLHFEVMTTPEFFPTDSVPYVFTQFRLLGDLLDLRRQARLQQAPLPGSRGPANCPSTAPSSASADLSGDKIPWYRWSRGGPVDSDDDDDIALMSVSPDSSSCGTWAKEYSSLVTSVNIQITSKRSSGHVFGMTVPWTNGSADASAGMWV